MRRIAAGLAATLWIVRAGLAGAAGDPSQPGAYCPFPEPGETPRCFAEVEREYGDFFRAVRSGEVEGEPVEALERDLRADARASSASLALSSLAYGYFMLAERVAASPQPDPLLVARLRHWNELLGSVYREAEAESGLRLAVRDAALDLHARAPAVEAECGPGEVCPTTGVLLETLRAIDDPRASDSGVRGALGALLGRLLSEQPGEAAESTVSDE